MSTLILNKWENPDGTENFKCRAWVNFNGTGTVAIRASGNVSSITDNGTGDYTVNFAAPMPDVNYTINIQPGGTNGVVTSAAVDQDSPRTIGAIRFRTYNTSFVSADCAQLSVIFVR